MDKLELIMNESLEVILQQMSRKTNWEIAEIEELQYFHTLFEGLFIEVLQKLVIFIIIVRLGFSRCGKKDRLNESLSSRYI